MNTTRGFGFVPASPTSAYEPDGQQARNERQEDHHGDAFDGRDEPTGGPDREW